MTMRKHAIFSPLGIICGLVNLSGEELSLYDDTLECPFLKNVYAGE